MTTYGVDVEVKTQERTFDARRSFDARGQVNLGGKVGEGGKLTAPSQRTQRTGNYGNNSAYRPPQSATQARRMDGSGNYGNPMRTHINVTATEVPGSKRQTLGNRARVASSNASSGLGKAAKTAGKVAKTVGGKISPGVGINAKGDIDFGLRAGGAGLSISGKGDISLGVPGLSATINPKNPTDTTVDIGFGAITIEQTRVGCSIIVTIKMGGKIINQDTRKADDCVEPEPTPEPTPTPTPAPTPAPSPSPSPSPSDVTNDDNLTLPPPKSFTVPAGFTGWVCPMYTIFHKSNTTGVFVEILEDENGIPNGKYYQYWVTSTASSSRTGFAPAGTYYDLSYEERGGSSESGNPYPSSDTVLVSEGNLSNVDNVTVGYFNVYLGLDEEPPTPYKYKGYGYSQGVPRLTFGFTRYYDRYLSTIANEPRYTFGHFIDDACQRIDFPFVPNFNKPYQTTPKAIPPMEDEKCCELNKRIYEMLGGDDFFNKGISIPNSIYVPGGSGETQALTYHELNNLLFRTLAYRTPGNIEVKLKDSNIMKEGEQPLTYKATDATSYFNKLMEVTMSQDTDLSALINLIIRLNWIAVQILNISVKINQMSQSIIGFFGVPCKDTTVNVDIPVDPSLGQKVGFEAKKPTIDKIVKLLDLDDPTETRKLLDKFMNFARIPVTVKKLVSTAKGGNYWWLLDKNKR